MQPIRFIAGPHGHQYGIASDGTEIVRCMSGYETCTYYRKSRPDIDNQRVRMRYEELAQYGLHRPAEHLKPFSLDQHDNMHWGDEVLKLVGKDKEGFPLYEWQPMEVIGPGFTEESEETKKFRAFLMSGEYS